MSPCSRFRGWMVTSLSRHRAHLHGHPAHDDDDILSWNFLVGALASSIVVASAVHLIGDRLAFLEVPAFTIASNVVERVRDEPLRDGKPQADPVLSSMALVAIDDERFERTPQGAARNMNVYGGVSPLARCALWSDLERLLAVPDLQTLAVDISLAPPISMSDAEKECQERIDRLIDANSQRLVLIEPLGNGSEQPGSNSEHQKTWMIKRQANNVRFAGSELQIEYGMTRRYLQMERPDRAVPLGELFAQSICRHRDVSGSSGVCLNLPRQDSLKLLRFSEHEVWHPILIKELRNMFRNGVPMSVDDECLNGRSGPPRPPRCKQIRHLLFGGTYGIDDKFLTPVGLKSGMEVHAAIASRPRADEHHFIGFVLDIVIGTFLIAPCLKFCWKRYFRSAMAVPIRSTRRMRDPYLAWAWLLLLALLVIGLLIVLVIGSVYLYTNFGDWISPVPMVVGMAIDAFVIQGVETAQHQLHRAGLAAASARASFIQTRPRLWRRVGHALPCAAALTIVIGALWQMRLH